MLKMICLDVYMSQLTELTNRYILLFSSLKIANAPKNTIEKKKHNIFSNMYEEYFNNRSLNENCS